MYPRGIFGGYLPFHWWTESTPLGWNRVEIFENLGATEVVPADTFLNQIVKNTNKASKTKNS